MEISIFRCIEEIGGEESSVSRSWVVVEMGHWSQCELFCPYSFVAEQCAQFNTCHPKFFSDVSHGVWNIGWSIVLFTPSLICVNIEKACRSRG